jgi:hypothetical protein
LKDLATFFVNLFQDLKLPVRWLAFISLLVLMIVGVLGFEQLTGNFYLSKLERKVALLKNLQSIADAGIDNHPELRVAYEKAVAELSAFEVRTPASYIPSLQVGNTTALGKAISGAVIWIIVLIFGVSSDIQKNGKMTGTTIGVGIVLLLIAAVFAWVGTLIPTIYNPWVNYIAFPIAQLIVLFLLFGRRKRASA